jgi:spermidine synthase
MLLTAIFVVSLSTLAFEVLLTRVFAIGQWNHLSFMVISIALFGFGASGTFLSLLEYPADRRRWSLTSRVSISTLLCLYSVTAILSFLALNCIPLDYFRLPVEPLQSIYLLITYLCLSLPFFISGLMIAIGYTTAPQRAGLVYFATMAGSALGAVVPALLLPLLDEGKLIIIAAAVPLIPAMAAALGKNPEDRTSPANLSIWRPLMLACSLTTAGMVLYLLTTGGLQLIRVTPSPYKALGQILQFPKTRIVESYSSIKGRFDQVESPYIRFAPGLSLKYTQMIAPQHVIYKDGDNPLVLYDLTNKGDSSFATYMLSFAAYALIPQPEDVLLIQQGGGSAVPCALASGADRIAIIEPNKSIAGALRRKYPALQLIDREPRVFLAQSTERYDIIQIENWGTTIPGAAALGQEHTFTLEAFREYWDHLKPAGIFSISRKLLLPPSDSLRIWSTAYKALQSSGVSNPENHLALIRNFDTFTFLVSKSGIDVPGLKEFARDKNFDLVYLKSMDPNMANTYHVFQEPFHHSEINRLAEAWISGQQNDYFKAYLLDVRPQSDRRPFPSRFLKWHRLRELYASLGSRFYALFMSGEIVVALVFVEALLLAVLLLIFPVVLAARKNVTPHFARVSYFFGIGTGFMFFELYFIKFFILIFGDPIISFTLVVSAILIFSSLGGLYVQSETTRNTRAVLCTLIGVLILVTVGQDLLINYLLKLSTVRRYFVVLLLLLPVGFLMGLPFPLGMRYLLKNPIQRAYAWSVNGCAAVLSAIAAAQLAMSFGIPSVAVLAVVSYLVAWGAAKKMADGGRYKIIIEKSKSNK